MSSSQIPSFSDHQNKLPCNTTVVKGIVLITALLWGLSGAARADFITGYGWLTSTANNDLAQPSTLTSSTCHKKSDGTTEPCLPSNADVTFTTEAIGFDTRNMALPQTLGKFLNSNPQPLNNKIYQNGASDATPLDNTHPIIFDFVGFGTFTGTPQSPQSFTFEHDDGLTFIVNQQTVVNKPNQTAAQNTPGTYTGGAGNHIPFQLVYLECCSPPAVLQTTLVGPTADPNPLSLTILNPSSAQAGGNTFTLTATGAGFVADSVLMWNGSPRTTTVVNSGQITATIPAADIQTAGTVSVNVVNAAEGATSNVLPFTITPGNGNPNPAPTLISISPNTAAAGASSFLLTINGSNFINASVVQWNGSNQSTNFINGTQLTTTISATNIANAGTASITVFNPAPGGGTSNAVTFTITSGNGNQPPTLTSLNPNTAQAGFPNNIVMTVIGTGFDATSVVHWNGTAISTQLNSATSIAGTVTPGLVTSAGTAMVTVLNSPATGGLSTNSLPFTITAGSSGSGPWVVQQPSASPNPVNGLKTTDLSVLGATLSNNGDEGVLNYTWSINGPAPVTLTANGTNAAKKATATFNAIGTYTFQSHIVDTTLVNTNTPSSVDSNPLEVIVNPAVGSIAIINPISSLPAGQFHAFQAQVKDQFGQNFNTPISWTQQPPAGALNATVGSFTAPLTGQTITVKATAQGQSALDPVTILDATGSGGSLANVKIGPVPFKANSGDAGINFKNLPAGAKIRFFTLTGRLVQSLDVPNGGDKLWDIKNANQSRVASGVYLYIIEGGGEKKEGKVVVIQ